jgi:hypothetical protein
VKGRIYHDCVNDQLFLVAFWDSETVVLETDRIAKTMAPVTVNMFIKNGFLIHIGNL